MPLYYDLASPPAIGDTTPAAGTFTPLNAIGPAIVNSGFAGTVTAANSTTVTFSSAADAILAGYNATNPTLGVTLISNALTRNIVSWTNATTCVVDTAVTWAGTAITSVQLPIATFVNSNGAISVTILANGNIGIGTTTFGTNAAKVLAIGSGTAPTTSPADAAQMWVADSNSVAGAAALHMRNEVGKSGAVAFKTLTTKTISTTPVTLTANEIADGLILVTTGASVINLPAGDASLDGAPVKFRTIAAVAFSTKPNGVQIIDLAGTDLTGGNKITSDGTAGVEYTLVWDGTASKWRTLSISGVVVDGGA